jgi:hypothetical protein
MSTVIYELADRQNQSWFQGKLEELNDEERVRAGLDNPVRRLKRNITLPLDIEDYYILDKVAQFLGMSKTAVAVNMLADALNKAYSYVRPEDETPESFWENVVAFAEKGGE